MAAEWIVTVIICLLASVAGVATLWVIAHPPWER